VAEPGVDPRTHLPDQSMADSDSEIPLRAAAATLNPVPCPAVRDPSVNPCATNSDRAARQRCRVEAARQLQLDWIARLAFGPERGRARLVQIWTGIFAVSWRQLPHPDLLRGQLATIEAQLGGSFGQLLAAMLLNPAVQISLNGPSNHRSKPNENLARELLELFSLGEGNYGEADVREAAKALSGYQLSDEGRMVLNPRRHDAGRKTILGRNANFDAPNLAAWLAAQPATARHICGRLWLAVVGPLPPPARLRSMAEDWRRQRLSLPWLMQALQDAPEARAARGKRLEDPILVVSRSLALLGSRHPDALQIARGELARMGQPVLEPPSVKGWPVNEEWINLRWLQARRRGLAALLADEEVWASATPPPQLLPTLTPIPPLEINLPAPGNRAQLAQLFADPVWQLA
jgi:uncharacterized protein (DUF1800 family)